MTLKDFERIVPAQIVERGENYWRQGRVKLVTSGNDIHFFSVRGSDGNNYTVSMNIEGEKVVAHHCNCPHTAKVCKHVVACLYYIVNNVTLTREKEETMEREPIVVAESIEQMTPTLQAYLCFLAYTGMDANVNMTRIPKIDEFAGFTIAEQHRINQSLRESLWLVDTENDHMWLYNRKRRRYSVNPKHHIKILLYALEHRKEWIAKFKQFRVNDIEIEVLVNIARYIDEGEVKINDKELYDSIYTKCTETFLKTVGNVLCEEYGKKLINVLSERLLDDVVNDCLLCAEMCGEVRLLQQVRSILENRRVLTPKLRLRHSLMRRDWFYFKGELLPYTEADEGEVGTLLLNAAITLFEGRTDDSIALYKKAITKCNKQFGLKGLPDDELSLFIYVMALAIRYTPDDVKTLNTLYKKAFDADHISCEGVRLFLFYFKDSQQHISSSLRNNLTDNNPMTSGLATLFAMFNNRHKPMAMPIGLQCAFLQSELAALNPKIEKVAWPYPALVTRIKRVEKWEMMIDEIIASVRGSVEIETAGNERVFYLARREREEVEIKVQTRLKSGKWGKGVSLSNIRWHDGNAPMDSTDRAIHADWLRKRGYYLQLSDILPHCKGKDKIYTEYNYYEFGPVEVREEKPFIYTERQDGNIILRTNVPEEAMKKMYKWSTDGRSITYWTLSPAELSLFRSVVNLKSVPETAEPKLEQLFTMLKDKVEVQSDIRGAVQLDEREGSSLIAVRIVPDGEQFRIEMLAHPLEKGEKYLKPGKGDETILDSEGSTRCKVKRDLKAENRNLKAVMNLMGDGMQLGTNGYIIGTEGLLDIIDSAEEMKHRYYIEWPEGEVIKIVEPKSNAWRVTATGDGGWFEIEGDVQVTEDQVFTIAEILELLHNNAGGFVRLKSGEYMKLSQRIRSQLDSLDAVSQSTRGKITIPELAMTIMGEYMEDVVEVMDSKSIAKRRRQMREAAGMEFAIPEGLNAILRPYQEEGYRWMMSLAHWGAGACLADDMGLGKTVQAIAFMLAKKGEGAQMVIAPASVIGNWHNELSKFAPSLKVLVLNDHTSADRATVLSEVGEGWVVVTTYGVLVSDAEVITERVWATVVLDEAHTIKNRDTKTSAAAMLLKAGHRIILTGTPIQNHLGELWNLFRFINPGLLGSYEHFDETYVGRSESRDALKRLVSPFLLRRTKNEVVKELPDKIEVKIPVQMSAEEMAVYEVIRRMAKAELESGGSLSVNALAMMTKLRMAACSATLAEKKWKGGCTKLEVFIEKLETIVESGNSVLVFSQFTSFLQMAREVMESRGMSDYLYLDGSTPLGKRQKMVASFQKGEHHIFLISLKAGGLGLNLTGANYVIHLDPWWNPAIEQQATDRAYRIGQQQKVTVYHLISENTIEEKIVRMHESKRQIADSILDGTESPTRLTPQELLELLGY